MISGERLPFADHAFDCVVSTLVLCSVARVESVLAELFRVLVPGGRYVFLEHGASPDEKVLRWQRRLNGWQRFLADGCRLDLEVPRIIASQPFAHREFDSFYLPKAPKTHGYIYRGHAVK